MKSECIQREVQIHGERLRVEVHTIQTDMFTTLRVLVLVLWCCPLSGLIYGDSLTQNNIPQFADYELLQIASLLTATRAIGLFCYCMMVSILTVSIIVGTHLGLTRTPFVPTLSLTELIMTFSISISIEETE